MLASAEVVVADLTYARPSVYFEAGYAARAVPVIYTCRADHLRPDATDLLGNRRVHFDLQMKNIVKWSSPTDQTFGRRLAARVRKVTTPLVQRKAQELSTDKEDEEFRRLAVNQRAAHIETALRKLFARHRLSVAPDTREFAKILRSEIWNSHDGGGQVLLERLAAVNKAGIWLSALGVQGQGIVVWAGHFGFGTAERQLTAVAEGLVYSGLYNMQPAAQRRQAEEHIIVLSGQSIRRNAVERRLPDAEMIGRDEFLVSLAVQAIDPTTLPSDVESYYVAPLRHPEWHRCVAWSQRTGFRIKTSDGKDYGAGPFVPVARDVHVHLVDNVTSVQDAERRVEQLLRDAKKPQDSPKE